MVLNPLLLAGQVHGGITQGIGQALLERTVYGEDGQLVTASFMDYAVPRAEDAPSFVFETRNVPCTTNALGVKGAGEAGTIAGAGTVMNAVVDALDRAYGIRHIDMPATPLAIYEAISAATPQAGGLTPGGSAVAHVGQAVAPAEPSEYRVAMTAALYRAGLARAL